MTWVSEYNYTTCGRLISKEFEPPVFTAEEEEVMTEQEKKDVRYAAYQKWLRVDFKRVKLVPFAYS